MTDRYLKRILFATLLLLAILSGIAIYNHYFDAKNMRGKYVFANSRQKIESLSAFKIVSAGGNEINLYRKGDSWRFKEANDYFVNTDMIRNFYNMINNSIVISVHNGKKSLLAENNLLNPQETSDRSGAGTLLITYDINGGELDRVILGKKNGFEDYVFARDAEHSYSYTINSVGIFNGNPEAWIPYPLLQVQNQYIEGIALGGNEIDREQIDYLLLHSAIFRKLFDVLNFIDYQGNALRSDLRQAFPDAKPQRIEIAMIGGLVYIFDIYHVEGSYWMEITLASKRLAHKDILPFIQKNQQYFSDWVFQLATDQGELMYNIRIAHDKLEAEIKQ